MFFFILKYHYYLHENKGINDRKQNQADDGESNGTDKKTGPVF